MSGGSKRPKTDASLVKRQKEELERAEREEERLRQERIAGIDAKRRKKRGLFSLLKTEGGELGAPKQKLGGSS